ncbi:hypothetical protein FB446DRAFT_288323 [Lentinula raphanica]|nr:hypothetical protein FB446DRAFT_288323 [Lentinula raphanica]
MISPTTPCIVQFEYLSTASSLFHSVFCYTSTNLPFVFPVHTLLLSFPPVANGCPLPIAFCFTPPGLSFHSLALLSFVFCSVRRLLQFLHSPSLSNPCQRCLSSLTFSWLTFFSPSPPFLSFTVAQH